MLHHVRPAVVMILCLSTNLASFFQVARAEVPMGLVWPQFRGPTQQGHADESAQPPVVFSETEKLVYKTPLPGIGWSSPVIADNEIWLTTALLEEKKLQAICVDFHTGQIVRSITVFEPEEWEEIHLHNSHASPTPVIDERHVYVHFGAHGNAAISRASGEIIWKNTDIKVDYLTGAGSHPVLFEESLIITCDGADKNVIAALDRSTGKVLWTQGRSQPLRSDPDTHRAFSTPLLIQGENNITTTDLMVSIGPDQIHGYDPHNGEELWHATYLGFSTVPMPITDGEHIFFSTGFNKATYMAIKLGGVGKINDSHVTWTNTKGITLIPSPLLIESLIYMPTEKGLLICLDSKTGEQVYQERLGGNVSSSPIYAGGHIYLADQDGNVHVIKPGRTYEPIHKNVLQSGLIKASPAPVDNSLVLRSESFLYRFATSGP